MTGGNTSALELAFRTFTERGTYALADEYTYATAFECANPLGVKMIGIKLDEEGPIPSDMDDILSSWDEQKMGSKKPHVLYTVPTGHNPTGSTQSTQRRQEIYNLASKHDIIILEDDPYYFLQLAGEVAKDASELIKPTAMADLLPSFLKLDVDGRVYRMDSCSKILAPGLRTGWITASAQITERIVRAHEISLQQPSGFSQAFLYKLFAEQWKMEGLFRWFNHLQIGYTTRRDALMRACEANLPKEVASWNVPKAGVFVSAFPLSLFSIYCLGHNENALSDANTRVLFRVGSGSTGSCTPVLRCSALKILRRKFGMLLQRRAPSSFRAAGSSRIRH